MANQRKRGKVMSEERLSRLQKWILMAFYIMGPEYRINVKDLKETSIRGLKIWGKTEILESPWRSKIKWPSIEVSFSRSLRELYCKGFIDGFSGLHFSGLPKICLKISGSEEMRGDPYCGMNLKSIVLTEEGKAKAQEFLNVKNVKVNNKELLNKSSEVNMEQT
jgi:hypothetical protein